MTEIRCKCGKMLGERAAARLIIRRIGLILHGGTHTWDCPDCGRRQSIDLEAEEQRLDTHAALVAH